jgi:hypothetical protein
LALVLSGTSDLFVLMVQLGRDVFDTRLSAQSRVDIYERLLGIIIAARREPASRPKAKPAAAPRIQQLLHAFEKRTQAFEEKRTPAMEMRAGKSSPRKQPSLSMLGRTRSTPIQGLCAIGGFTAPRTQPTTPVARLSLSLSDDDCDSPQFSRSLPASPNAAAMRGGSALFVRPEVAASLHEDEAIDLDEASNELLGKQDCQRHCTNTEVLDSSKPPTPKASAGVVSHASNSRTPTSHGKPTALLLPSEAVRARIEGSCERPSRKRWPSQVFATSEDVH